MNNIGNFDNIIQKGLKNINIEKKQKQYDQNKYRSSSLPNLNICNDYPMYYNNLYLHEYV